MEIVERPDGNRIKDPALSRQVSPRDAYSLAVELMRAAPKAEGRKQHTVALPLLDGTVVTLDGLWPITAADWDQMLSVLSAFRAGLVKEDAASPSPSPREDER